MMLALIAIVVGLVLLIWGADRFVIGASVTARFFGISPMIIGITIVGFGTSAPEMMVSAISAWQNNSGIALGNAYGSNISNISLILGATAIIKPIVIPSKTHRKEIPLLLAVTGLAAWQLYDGTVSRFEAIILLSFFLVWMSWTLFRSLHSKINKEITKGNEENQKKLMPLWLSVSWMLVGLILLVISSQILVWGAVSIAKSLGVSDLIIGLTIVAVGTSLPELASSLAASRRGENEIALGNVIGSNLFNSLIVVGIAGVISPISVGHEVLYRDVSVMTFLTLFLFIVGFKKNGNGEIGRFSGVILLFSYVAYSIYLIYTAFS